MRLDGLHGEHVVHGHVAHVQRNLVLIDAVHVVVEAKRALSHLVGRLDHRRDEPGVDAVVEWATVR